MLTDEQKAKRRTTRYNNRAKKDLPLLAWGGVAPQTTIEEQAAALERVKEDCARHAKKMADHDITMLETARVWEERVKAVQPPGRFQRMKQWQEKSIAQWPPLGGVGYRADYWHQMYRGRLGQMAADFVMGGNDDPKPALP